MKHRISLILAASMAFIGSQASAGPTENLAHTSNGCLKNIMADTFA